MKQIIAIDGPAGAGKSTVAKAVAARLGYLYIDTGAMYRTIGLIAMRRGIAFDDEAALVEETKKSVIDMRSEDGKYLVFLNGEDVSEAIRTPAGGDAASAVSSISGVRRILVEKQRELARDRAVVLDGRDIGTVVFPQADLKIYLTASVDVRAARRCAELQAKGIDSDFEATKADIAARDERDMNRADSPLKMADDAVLVDSDNLNAEEVIEKILALVMAD